MIETYRPDGRGAPLSEAIWRTSGCLSGRRSGARARPFIGTSSRAPGRPKPRARRFGRPFSTCFSMRAAAAGRGGDVRLAVRRTGRRSPSPSGTTVPGMPLRRRQLLETGGRAVRRRRRPSVIVGQGPPVGALVRVDGQETEAPRSHWRCRRSPAEEGSLMLNGRASPSSRTTSHGRLDRAAPRAGRRRTPPGGGAAPMPPRRFEPPGRRSTRGLRHSPARPATAKRCSAQPRSAGPPPPFLFITALWRHRAGGAAHASRRRPTI